MTHKAIRNGDWVVVCDGRKALILENVGDDKFPNLRSKATREHSNASTRAQGADEPGRSYSSVGHGRSAVSQTDWHDEAERSFLKSLADYLDTAVQGDHTKKLFIAAPPRALGMIRPNYSHAVRGAVVAEIDKDLVKMPISEIEGMLFPAPAR